MNNLEKAIFKHGLQWMVIALSDASVHFNNQGKYEQRDALRTLRDYLTANHQAK